MLTPAETAALFWQMLEQQRSMGLKSLRDIPVQLRKLAPLQWRTGFEYREGLRLLEGWYAYSPESAQGALGELKFDVVGQLQRLGYKGAQRAFYEAIQDYYDWRVSYAS